jgi:DNA-binding phage protein
MAGMDIIQHIRARGMTVRAVCKAAGVTRQTFYNVIKPGGGNPKVETITAIARAAGVAPADIRPELGNG